MKKFLFSIAATAALCFAMMGCGNPPTQTPVQQAAAICPAVQAAVTALQADVGLPQGFLNDLAKGKPVIAAACSGLATVQNTDVVSLVNFAIETVLPLAQASNPKLAAELTALQILVDLYNAYHPASPVTPVPAPPAAKTTAYDCNPSEAMLRTEAFAAARIGTQ